MFWNHGDLMDAIAPLIPADAPATIHGDKIVLWPEFNLRTNSLARSLIELGGTPGTKVGFYMRNMPAYTELLAACFRGRLVHVNVNYRYQTTELHYIFDNSDSEFVVYDPEFADQIALLRDRLPDVKGWIEVNGDADLINDFAIPYESLVTGDGSNLDIERSPEDMLFIYTGGTTGMPKGVMWQMHDLRQAHLDAGSVMGPVPTNMEEHIEFVQEAIEVGLPRAIPACPLMHGTGLFAAIGAVVGGGCIVTLPTMGRFDPAELWETVEKHKVTGMAIVGDAFAKPMLQVLDDDPGKYDLSTLATITSSGTMWSRDVKLDLLKHMPNTILSDSFGSSEAVGFGYSLTTSEGTTETAKFAVTEFCKVFSEDDREIEPGSGERGFIARAGSIPVGYYKDEVKSAETFKTIDGVRYSIPGDWCIVEADGTLTLLGRGSVCINTAGEKVFPEEIEEVLKEHPSVTDALVVGVPDDKWGNAVTGVVQLNAGANVGEDELRSHVRERLAGYKVPKRVLFRPDLKRAPNGKADYKRTTEFAVKTLGIG
ncbi:MAG: acyl-CoA synthetase [Alphaproteobacteria bacterium]|nr:MAG: acyl-CoA synthetase [Alphaproteobacteria bacterium]